MSACACGGDNDFVRCDLPVDAIELCIIAWAELKANPSSWDAFERFEWAIKLASVKFDTYATNRRIEATRADNL